MNFGDNLEGWLTAQLGSVLSVIIILVSIYFLTLRQFSRLIGFLIFAMIVSVVILQPEKLKNLGVDLWGKIFGG
ncbi:hypothetical protein [Thalassobacillus pellis]|uniref:hypothetical protein n=1 Tax=Thalassobacillus pellis TaxID=748008 RepID=UPI00195F43F0|nr:hypothetical protein [Thalassobacillus pellis]MBM7554573.1 hypothetical protein [Thalassobacillus pellis]